MAEGFDLSGRVALVTGGSKGLGKAMARGLAKTGADVAIVSRHADELGGALDEILAGCDGRGTFVAADLAERGAAARVADQVVAELGRVDILVNNAGASVPQAIAEITDEAWDHVVQLQLTTAMALTRAVAPAMIERGWGRVVHISSVLAYMSRPGRAAYSACKAALGGLARATALDLGPAGITVNCLAPGPFATDMGERGAGPDGRDAMAQRTALGRWGRPDELTGALLLLAGDAGSYITGSTLVVDGGWLAA
jgi:NAD(P)-dependent dehydrogenase (short-subunit alcohol dehydrogenase family)